MSYGELAPTLNGQQNILLVPNSGVQFIDFALSLPETSLRFEMAYTGKRDPEAASAPGVAPPRSVIPARRDRESGRFLTLDGQPVDDDHVFSISGDVVLGQMVERWFPLPYLRRAHGKDRLDVGPTNWVRAYLMPLPEDEAGPNGERHRLVVAVDTTIEPPGPEYLAPTTENIAQNSEQFCFAVGDPSLAIFLDTQAWLKTWSERTCDVPRLASMPEVVRNAGRAEQDQFRQAFPFAMYCAFLQLIGGMLRLPDLRFMNTDDESGQIAEIPVDLVLDVGNSRTCGIVFEHVDTQASLSNCYTMMLRDLSRPGYVHKGPFSSRMELVDFAFGDEFSAQLGRQSAFRWPSMARIGPEAQRLAGCVFGNEGDMGLSSPKRYIWDTRPTINTWYLNPHGRPRLAQPIRHDVRPANKGDLAGRFSDDGERVTDDNPIPALTPRYSRSAMMTFFLVELFLQAINQINAPHVRYNRQHFNRYRRIRRIVLTVPTAMTLEERLLFQRRACDAQEVLWDVLGQTDITLELVDQWDEAVATQAVFLYNETRSNYLGNTGMFFSQVGRTMPLPRALTDYLSEQRVTQTNVAEAPAIRIASLDIGGGTTDLIITTYYLIDRRTIVPQQNFREGFNVAGDDVLGDLIQKLILPKLAVALQASAGADPLPLLDELVGADREGATTAIDHNMRRQFCSLVLIPTAIRLIEAYDSESGLQPGEAIELMLGAALDRNPGGRGQLEAHVGRKNERAGRHLPQSVFDLPLTFSRAEIDSVVRNVIASVVSDLAEVVYGHDCDFMLLSGRPSRMPAVKDLLLSHLPVAPHRLIAMHDYVVDNWYPFRSIDQRLRDPKTTVSVGAMICAMSNRLQGFFMLSDQLHMRSTARYIGEINGYTIPDEQVLFSGVRLDDEDLGGGDAEVRLSNFTGPLRIGFRQMRHRRWQATPYYELDFSPEVLKPGAPRPVLPGEVAIGLRRPTRDKPFAIEIREATDRNGRSMRSALDLRLNTLSSFGRKAEQHWLDAGIFDLREISEIASIMTSGARR